jgi:hypothetical protein
LVRLVAQRTRAHGQLYGGALDPVGRNHNAAVLAHLAIVAPATSDDDIDVGLFAVGLEFTFFALQW